MALPYETPFGAQLHPDGQGALFQLWAPSAREVALRLNDRLISLSATEDGWYRQFEPDARAGDRYGYRIDGHLDVPDPASRFQPDDVHGTSLLVDPSRYDWGFSGWAGRPWRETILYEIHVGTFSPEGTFRGVQDRLDDLRDLGVTALELMPLSDFPGRRNWGYDGVLPFAPDSRYGGPDDLKNLIRAAHEKGLMVFLDVVYNHFGPEGNYLYTYARPFFSHERQTPWGDAIHFSGPRPVREFFIQNALYWLLEYRFDGLRLDAIHAIHDPSPMHVLTEMAETVRKTVEQVTPGRHVHLVLENDDNTVRFLSGEAESRFTAQWNDDFHHAAHVLATGEAVGYYSDFHETVSGKSAATHLTRCLAEGFAYQGDHSPYRHAVRGEKSTALSPVAFVHFLQNHDQIGNRAFGERLPVLAEPQALRALLEMFLLAPAIPLLFMGEEWQSDRPFPFFCDFEGELGRQVTEGRRREFARFPQFSDPEVRHRIPDPCAVETFEAARLDWDVRDRLPHQEWLSLYKTLLEVRHREVIPRLPQHSHDRVGPTECKIFGRTGMTVRWPLHHENSLVLTANPGDEALTLPSGLPDNMNSDCCNIFYGSFPMAIEAAKSGKIPPWSVIWAVFSGKHVSGQGQSGRCLADVSEW